jgi:mono/diheme cytochrome c family protein
MVRILTFLLFTAAICSGARAEDGSAVAGLAYARTVCAECHAIRSDDLLSPNPKAPSFAKIASTPGVTGAALFVILQTPHREMPDLIIPAKEKADVVAYILSLKK